MADEPKKSEGVGSANPEHDIGGMTLRRKPYRTSYDQLVQLIEATGSSTNVTISELRSARYQAWLLGKALGFIERRGRTIDLTSLGRRFLESHNEVRSRMFRSQLEKEPSFSSIWGRVLEMNKAEDSRVKRSDLMSVVRSVTDTQSKNLVEQYTASVVNFATNAGLMNKDASGRDGVYDLVSESRFGDIATELLPSPPSASSPKSQNAPTTDYLRDISLLVYDVLNREHERDRHIAELRSIHLRLTNAPDVSGMSEVERRIVLHELKNALDKDTRDAFQWVAETLGIIRGERGKQRSLSDF